MRAIDADALQLAIVEEGQANKRKKYIIGDIWELTGAEIREVINSQPTIQPEPHEIGYDDCANALLKMWMDNVLTDGEYYRIANKLNKKWGKKELPEPYKGVTT